MPVDLGGQEFLLPYAGNYDLEDFHEQVTRAVVVFHGGPGGSAEAIFDSVLNAAINAGAESNTFVLAPQRLRQIDVDAHGLSPNVLYWDSGSINGDQSTNGSPTIGFFSVIDIMLQGLAEGNPNLETIVVAGHSGGGQLVNRYAAGTQVEQALNAEYGIAVTYIPANPRTYLYFDEKRAVHGKFDMFAVPNVSSCPVYNDYRSGLENLNAYMSDVGVTQIKNQYQSRRVVYMVGGSDTRTPPGDDCEGLLQGADRLERAIIYYNHLGAHFGDQIYESHTLSIVPGVGHDHFGMFNSDCGVFYLFDTGDCLPSLVPLNPKATTKTAPVAGTSWSTAGTLRVRDKSRGKTELKLVLQIFFGPQSVSTESEVIELSSGEFLLFLGGTEEVRLSGTHTTNKKGKPKKLFPEPANEFVAQLLTLAYGDASTQPVDLRKFKLKAKGRRALKVKLKVKTTHKTKIKYVGSSNLQLIAPAPEE